jgi:hypothetical protein
MSAFELATSVVILATIVTVFVVLPVFALWKTRREAPPGRDPAFVQRSENPMPDKTYLGHGDAA